MFFNLKLKETVDFDAALQRLSGVVGITNITRMFPGETDPETASLYRVELNSDLCPVAEYQVWTALQSDPDVEFVEKSARRKLRV